MIALTLNDSTPRLLVIGAGPAGVSAAIRLRDRGHRVLLVDRSAFPRDKVCGCCLNLAAIGALSTIGCDQVVMQLATGPLTKWQMRLGDRRVEARLPGGIALSRYAMDSALIQEAMRRGVQFRPSCEARVVEVGPDSVDLCFRDPRRGDENREFNAVVYAAGLKGGGVARWLQFTQSPSGPIGVGMLLEPNYESFEQIEPDTIHMICGQEGYVGLVRLEDGRVDFASAIRRDVSDDKALNRAEIATRIDRLLSSSGLRTFACERMHELQMTPPLTRSRVVGHGALIAVGDAARYVEPFTGEGMAWAIESGIEAADCIADHLEGKVSSDETLAQSWAARYVRLVKRRQWICRVLSRVLGSKKLSNHLVPAIQAAPWMAKWTISQLNRARI